ncbi:MAG: hypothetical protein ACOYM3_24320 [Terrimicrobiaceae bacterium]
MQDHLVGFIDILGFGSQVVAATDPASFQKVYEQVKLVQAAFYKPSATEDPKMQESDNTDWGVRVLALSDSVVIAINPNCEAAPLVGPSDFLGDSIYGLAQSQYTCVLEHGIFLRGGLGVGPFLFENDILVSPAQVKAYIVESKHAEVPVIALCQKTLDWIHANSQGGTGVPGWQDKYFQPLQTNTYKNSLYFLDYLHVAIDDSEGDPKPILEIHRDRIETNLAIGKAKEKYQWLARYHNDTIAINCPSASSLSINV